MDHSLIGVEASPSAAPPQSHDGVGGQPQAHHIAYIFDGHAKLPRDLMHP
jgi:hypothetical protein